MYAEVLEGEPAPTDAALNSTLVSACCSVEAPAWCLQLCTRVYPAHPSQRLRLRVGVPSPSGILSQGSVLHGEPAPTDAALNGTLVSAG